MDYWLTLLLEDLEPFLQIDTINYGSEMLPNN